MKKLTFLFFLALLPVSARAGNIMIRSSAASFDATTYVTFSSAAASYLGISSGSTGDTSLLMTISSQAASNIVNQGQYMMIASQTASNLVNQGQYIFVASAAASNLVNQGQYLFISSQAASNLVNQGQYLFASSAAASNLVNQGQYLFTSSQVASNVVNQGQYLFKSSAAASNLVNQGQYLFALSSPIFNAALTQLSSFTVLASSVGTAINASSLTFNSSLLQFSSYSALISSMAASNVVNQGQYLFVASAAASNVVNQGQYLFASSQAASNLVNQGQYVQQSSAVLNLVSYSSAAASYLGISSGSAPSGDTLTKSSASVSYLGISSGSAPAPDTLTKSSASVSYVGISSLTVSNGVLTVSSSAVSYLGISSASVDSLTKSSATVGYLYITSATAQYQPVDADLTDLADGTLTGSKLGSGSANYLNVPSTGVFFSTGIAVDQGVFKSSLTIPSGLAPVLNGSGQIALDTTADQLLIQNSSIYVIDQATKQFTVSMSSGPSWFGFSQCAWCAPTNSAVTITSVRAVSLPTGSTVQYQLNERAYGAEGSAGSNLFTDAFSTANATGLTTQVLSDNSIAAGACLYYVAPASDTTKGSPTSVRITPSYTYQRQ